MAAGCGERDPPGRSPAAPARGGSPRRPAAVPRDVKKAVDFLRSHRRDKITVADLVCVCGVAERTLHKHFRVFLGVAPSDYLRRLRLAAVREELLSSKAGGSVTASALGHGFNHFGRFASQYRRRFGESPSSTLRRASRDRPGREGRVGDNAGSAPGKTPPIMTIAREAPSLVILPFRAAGIDNQFFAEELVDGLACALGSGRSLLVSVAARASAPIPASHRAIRDHGARYRLNGTVARAGERLRVIVVLSDAANERHLWGDSFDGGAGDLFELQDRVTEGATRAVLPQIRGAEIERAHRKRPEDLGAYDLTLQALALASAANPDAAKHGLDLLAKAMELDPDYAPAAAIAAWCHAQLVTYNGTLSVAEEKTHALRLANRAGVLDLDGDPLVLTARCAVHTMVNDLESGAALLHRALAADPYSAWAWERGGWLNTYRGKPETAIRHFERALRLSPARAPNAHCLIGIGSAHFDAGRYCEAASLKRRAILAQPAVAWVNRTLAVSYARLGDRLAALDALDALRRDRPGITISQIVGAVPFRRDFLDRVAEGLDDLGLPL